MSRLIDADAIIHVTVYDEEHEEHIVKKMTVEDMLDTYSNEGCPTIMPESMFYNKSAQQWIPCSERLPNTSGTYIVTRWFCKGESDERLLPDACYFDGTDTWYDDNRINHSRSYVTDTIVAWMPLPESYRKRGARMTRELAIQIIQGDTLGTPEQTAEAVRMAIEALSQPPSDDWEQYSDRLWKEAYERGKADAQKQGKWVKDDTCERRTE